MLSTAAICLSLAIYWEARGEPDIGQIAVGQVVLNRVNSHRFPNTVCGVVFQGGDKGTCQFSFYCDGRSDNPMDKAAWKKSQVLAEALLEGSVRKVTDADHYHAVYVLPYWAKKEDARLAIGKHIFYTLYKF